MLTNFPDRMRPPLAAKYTLRSQSTLAKLRCSGGGPIYRKLSKSIVYDRADLDAWLNARKHASTSEYAHA